MSEYTYTGIDRKGSQVKGSLSADHEGDVRMQLRGKGIRPTKIIEAGKNAMNADLGALFRQMMGNSVPVSDLVPLTRQLQVLLSSGVTIVQSLDILAEGLADPVLKVAMTTIRDKVNQGNFLWESMAGYPNIFPKIYVALIRAGESSGSLDQILDRLSLYLENSEKLKALIKGALVYPIAVIGVAVVVISVMMVFVIPKFKEMIVSNGQELPALTAFVLDLSNFMTSNIVVLVVGNIGFGLMVSRFLKRPEGKALLDRALFKVPYFGELIRIASVARFSRTLQTLLNAGMNLIDAIEICKATIGNVVIEDALSKMRAGVEGGKTLGEVLSRVQVFPRMAVQMISVGETSGSIDKMLEKLADFYEAEVERATSGLTKIIEPVMLVTLGGIIAGLLVALYLPIFKMAGGGE